MKEIMKAYQRLKHRKEQLESRVERDVPGPERETAKRLLKKVSKRLEDFEKANGIKNEAYKEKTGGEEPETEYKAYYTYSKSATYPGFDEFIKQHFGSFENFFSFMGKTAEKFEKEYQKNPKNHKSYNRWFDYEEPKEYYEEETRSVDELIKDLGILYLIFGSTYQTFLNYRIYKVRFLKQIEKEGAFLRVKANIYEDDELICKEIQIGFWPFYEGDDRVGDMEWSVMDNRAFKKYEEGSATTIFLKKILKEMQELWNSYFDEEVKKLPEKSKGDDFLVVIMPKEERRKKIREIAKNLSPKKFNRMTDIMIQLNIEYKDLAEYLENSGLVYEVRKNAIYIWHFHYDKYFKLIGYNLTGRDKVLNLLPEQ